ncbi:MAG: multicopper oxidase domain-containing protein [Gemmatimonadales bacterium]
MPTPIRSAALALAAACVVSSAAPAQTPPLVVANDNRAPAGTVRPGRLDLALEARIARWQPDLDVDTTVTVLAFAEAGGPPSIPGPLVRVRAGTEVRIRLRNTLTDSIRIGPPPPGVRRPGVPNRQFGGPDLVVRGLRAGTVGHDTIRIAAGAEREIRFRATKPGTYLYWGSLSTDTLTLRTGRDGQLSGAIVVDPADGEPDPSERIFVVTVLDLLPDSTGPEPFEDIFEMAINGRSWPHTERFAHAVGDTVRWRWLNGSDTRHPMHLHGFHFKLLARGQGRGDVVLPPDAPLGVTASSSPAGRSGSRGPHLARQLADALPHRRPHHLFPSGRRRRSRTTPTTSRATCLTRWPDWCSASR